MKNNNIFSIATKELTQDAFFTWLIKWADSAFTTTDTSLKNTAKSFVQMLLNKGGIQIDTIQTAETWLQWEKIDISALINNQYFVIIEDKTSTGTNIKTLNRYKAIAKKWADDNNHQTICLYVKTGNESGVSLTENVLPAEFGIINRQDIISILNLYNGTNEIIIQYRDYITDIEYRTNSFETQPLKDWGYLHWQGLYMRLEKHITDIRWDYVPNQDGGFQGAYWYWLNIPSGHSGNDELYLQIEQGKFCFKISLNNVDDITQTRDYWSKKIIESAINIECSEITRPNRMGSGKTMTIATVDMIYFTNSDGLFELDRFLAQIKKYEGILNEVVK